MRSEDDQKIGRPSATWELRIGMLCASLGETSGLVTPALVAPFPCAVSGT